MPSRTVAATTRQSSSAHRSAVELTTREVAHQLAAGLGSNLTAYIVGRNEQTVRRWIDGSQDPSLEAERLLRNTLLIFRLVVDADATTHVARSWFIGMNPQLDDLSPAEALREGDARDVLAAARAYITGG